jgi:hypothetical protein
LKSPSQILAYDVLDALQRRYHMAAVAYLDVARHSIREAFAQWRHNGAYEVRIDDGIGVDSHDDLMRRCSDAFIQRMGLTHRSWKAYEPHAKIFKSEPVKDSGRPVAGSIINDNDLQRNVVAQQ